MSEPTQNPTAEPISEDPALQAQQDLLESCLALAFDTYDAARRDKIVDPVVILLDCEDEIGAPIANAWLGADAVQNAIAEQRLENPDATTVYAQAFSMAECRQEIPQFFPYLAPLFSEKTPLEIPTHDFLAIAVTSGGASALTVPASAREPKL